MLITKHPVINNSLRISHAIDAFCDMYTHNRMVLLRCGVSYTISVYSFKLRTESIIIHAFYGEIVK